MRAFCQMVGRDLGQLLGTNLIVCVLCLPCRAGGLAGRDPVFLPVTVVCSLAHRSAGRPCHAVAGRLRPCAACRTTPPSGCPGQNRPFAAHWKSACGFGCIGTLVLGLLCFVSAFVFLRSPHSRATTPALPCWYFWRWIFWCWRFFSTLCAAVLPLQAPDSLLRRAGRLLLNTPIRCVAAGIVMLAGIGGMLFCCSRSAYSGQCCSVSGCPGLQPCRPCSPFCGKNTAYRCAPFRTRQRPIRS